MEAGGRREGSSFLLPLSNRILSGMRRLPVLALLPLLACGGSGTGPAPADLETISQAGSLANSAQVATDVTVAFKVLHGPSGAVTTPKNGKPVTFTVLTGGGTVAGAATTTVNTGADGVASAT